METLQFDFSNVGEITPEVTDKEAKENSFYTAMLRNDDPVEAFQRANSEYLLYGSSTLVSETQQLLQQENDEQTKTAIGNIIADETIPLEQKKAIVKDYAILGAIPVSLRDKYAEKLAANNPETQIMSDKSFDKMYSEKVEYLKNHPAASENALSAFFAGVAEKEFAAAATFGLISEKDYDLLRQQYKPVQEKFPLSTGLGGGAALLAGAPTGIIGGAVIAGGIQGAARYSELGAEGVDTSTRITAALADAGVTAAMMATPIWKAATAIKAAALNAGSFVTLGSLGREVQNSILEAYPHLQHQTNWKDITVEALMGAIVGSIFGRTTKLELDTPSPNVESRPYAGKPPRDGMPKGNTYSGEVHESTARRVEDTPALIAPRGDSPLEVTALFDKAKAADLGANSVLDDTGRFADAVGEDRATIIAEQFLAKVNKEELKDVPSGIIERIDLLTDAGIKNYVRTETNPFLYGKDVHDAVNKKFYDTMKNFEEASLHQSKSSITDGEDIVSGIATYGPTEDASYKTMNDAGEALSKLLKYVPEGAVYIGKVDYTTNTIKKVDKYDPTEGDYYLQWKFNHSYNREDALVFGEDAVKVDLTIPFTEYSNQYINKALTSLARIPYANRFVFPGTHFLKEWVTKGAMQAGDNFLAIEYPMVEALRTAVSALSRSKGETLALRHLITRGSDEAKVWSYGEISSILSPKGFKESQIKKIATAYFLDRRVDDLSYLFQNREVYKDLVAKGMSEYHINGQQIHAKPVKEIQDISSVWDASTNTARSISKEELKELYDNGGYVATLSHRKHIGGDYLDYVYIPSGTKQSAVSDYVLPRVKGHSPRGWEEYYFLDKAPKKARLNGKEVIDAEELNKLRSTVAAAGTKKDIESILKDMQKKHPDYTFTWRRDRVDSNSTLQEYRLYTDALGYATGRGDKLISVDGTAKQVDPLTMRLRSVSALARSAAFYEWDTLFKRTFLRSYSKYLYDPSSFPTSMADFKKPYKASEGGASDEMRTFRDAQVQYQYYRSIYDIRNIDEELWKRGFYWLGEAAESLSDNLAETLKFIGKKVYPPNIVKSAATAFLIFLNPIRTFTVQASQVYQYALARPEYMLNPNGFAREMASLLWSISLSSKGSKWQPLIDTLGAKAAGMSVKDYQKFLQSWYDSGLPYAVDSNIVLNGILGKGTRPLMESPLVSTGASAYNTLLAIPRAGKLAGYDPGEGFNLLSAWLFARHRFAKNNPDIDINSKTAQATITADARAISGELSRAGELAWSRGILSLPLQFMQVPYKIFLNTLTSKVWSPQEKSRMLFGNLVAFGAGAYFLSDAINTLREKYGSEVPEQVWVAIQGGMIDLSVNMLASLGVDENEKLDSTTLAVSKGFSPFGSNLVISELLSRSSEKPFQEVLFGPSWSMFNTQNGRIPTAIRDMADVFSTTELDTKEKIKLAVIQGAQATSGGSNWMKMQFALETGKIISGTGNDTGLHADRKAAIATLFGVSTYEQLDKQWLDTKYFDEQKEIETEAKHILRMANENVLFNYNKNMDQYYREKALINSYLSVIKNNPDHATKLYMKLDDLSRKQVEGEGDSIYTRMYKSALTKAEEDKQELSNFLRSSQNPKLQELADDLNMGMNIEEGKGY